LALHSLASPNAAEAPAKRPNKSMFSALTRGVSGINFWASCCVAFRSAPSAFNWAIRSPFCCCTVGGLVSRSSYSQPLRCYWTRAVRVVAVLVRVVAVPAWRGMPGWGVSQSALGLRAPFAPLVGIPTAVVQAQLGAGAAVGMRQGGGAVAASARHLRFGRDLWRSPTEHPSGAGTPRWCWRAPSSLWNSKHVPAWCRRILRHMGLLKPLVAAWHSSHLSKMAGLLRPWRTA
jgi:hypothetical protein